MTSYMPYSHNYIELDNLTMNQMSRKPAWEKRQMSLLPPFCVFVVSVIPPGTVCVDNSSPANTGNGIESTSQLETVTG
jgi:hypothetical protein